MWNSGILIEFLRPELSVGPHADWVTSKVSHCEELSQQPWPCAAIQLPLGKFSLNSVFLSAAQLKLGVSLLGKLFYLNRADLACDLTFGVFSYFREEIMIIQNTLCCPMLNQLVITVKRSFPLQKKMAKPFIQHMKKNSDLWHCTSRFCWDLTTLILALKLGSLMCWGMIEGKGLCWS